MSSDPNLVFDVLSCTPVGENWLKLTIHNAKRGTKLVALHRDSVSQLDNVENPKVLTLTGDQPFDFQNLKGSFFDHAWIRKNKPNKKA